MIPPPIDVSVVLPVRNAEGSIRQALAALATRLKALGGRHEVVVVDDGSEDASAQEAARAALAHPEVRVIPLRRRSGPGHAARVGLLAAAGLHRVLLPVLEEGDSPPGTWVRALARVRAGAALAVGWRTRVLALDSGRAVRAVEAACRHGRTFLHEVVRLARGRGLEVEEILGDEPRPGHRAAALTGEVRDALRVVSELRWPWRGPR